MKRTPLAEQLRPTDFDDYVGQSHLVGVGMPLRNAIEQGRIHSMIFWGPPGVGKTTLAKIIAKYSDLQFFALNAVSAGVKEVRAVIETAKKLGTALLFIDEIHRFNKAQQDALLAAVEQGTITLIGATTENPSFEVISPLLSRCQVYVLEHLDKAELEEILSRALANPLFASKKGQFHETEALFRLSGGDARKLYNLLELIMDSVEAEAEITNNLVEQIAQQKIAVYDKNGEQHYDIVSAFIKSIRGSDPNAVVYWLARMIEGGEDPKFIARRMLIAASEDIGNANPNALLLANACFDAVEKIGFPECRIILSQTAVYLATSAKSNSTYAAINQAQAAVKKTGDLPVPLHLRNAPTKLMKELGYGTDYKYAHNHSGNFVEQEFLPEGLSGTVFYEPGDNTREEQERKRLRALWQERYGY